MVALQDYYESPPNTPTTLQFSNPAVLIKASLGYVSYPKQDAIWYSKYRDKSHGCALI